MLNEILFPNSSLELNPEWIRLADWYDQNNMSDVIYFDSFESIDDVLSETNLLEVSLKMKAQNVIRENKVMNQWDDLLRRIA
jgi:hypothetical protein